ncbi:class F sortase [Streptomyces sp. NPDC014685]|uniref:class F sortase n=1 Tax=Streptomyces sp. NPDC014685 TaxID=3364881 RepID=UPI003700E671
MAAPQSTGSTSIRTASRTTLGRALMWPAVTAGVGVLLIYNSFGTAADDKPPAPPAAVASAQPSPVASPTPEILGSHAAPAPLPPSPTTVGPTMPRSVPKRLSIPAIGVNAPFTDLSLGPNGQLDAPPPEDSNLVGWYKDGATPGERGASIVAGHVDTMTGPAVFLQLQHLKPGAKVDITRADGSVATFKVDSVEQFSKAKFPDDRVYADTNSAQLRLITCGGAYDKTAKDYKDNVVAFAHLDTFTEG